MFIEAFYCKLCATLADLGDGEARGLSKITLPYVLRPCPRQRVYHFLKKVYLTLRESYQRALAQ
jgi:hypothetical protein